MFEKEAEEYQIRKHHQRLYGNKPVVMKELNTTYKDGFNDGYNRAKEEGKIVVEHFEAYGQCRDSRRIAGLEQKNAELKEEIKKWKDEWQEQVQKENDESYARTLQTMKLTKAKDHIKKLLDCLQQDTNDPQTNYYVVQYMTQAEQFLKEV